MSSRGVAAYSAGGTHLIQDIAGYFTGTPKSPSTPYTPNTLPSVVWPMSLTIPGIGITTPVHSGLDDAVLALGGGHWPGTGLPGRAGNMSVFGHRTSHTHPFRYLDQLSPGEQVVVTSGSTRYVYKVVETLITNPTDVETFGGWTGTPTITLVACHPPGSIAQRIVVRAELYDVY